MNIAVIGTGGIGGYLGGKLALLMKTNPELNVYFIARGSHLEAIRKNGLMLETSVGKFICTPTAATDKISDLPELDLCLICVKSYDLVNILEQLKTKITGKTVVIPLLNGMDIHERIRNIINTGMVFPACIYISSSIENPGRVVQKGSSCIIHFGKEPGSDNKDERLFGLFDDAGINYTWHDDVFPEIWSKFIFIASFGLVTATSGRSIGEIIQSEELSSDVKSVMNEIYELAEARNIKLPPTIIEDSFKTGANFPFETTTSFQRDYSTPGKPDEREIFGEAVIRLGKTAGVKTEVTEKLYNSL